MQKLFDIKSIDKSIKNETKRLCDLVDIETNNKECVVLKIKENSSLDLIKLGCFEGDENLIRITKGANHTITIFSGKNHYSWDFGDSGYTLVSKSMDQKRDMILDCIEIDFDIYIGKNAKLIEKSLDIQSVEDVINRENKYEVCKDGPNYLVHKNGEFFRLFSNIESYKNFCSRINSYEKSNENDLQNDNENDYDYN